MFPCPSSQILVELKRIKQRRHSENWASHNELTGEKKIQFQMCVKGGYNARLPQRLKSLFFNKKNFFGDPPLGKNFKKRLF